MSDSYTGVSDRELTVLLELASGQLTSAVTDSVLHKALEDVQMTWVTKQVSGQDYLQRMPLTDAEVQMQGGSGKWRGRGGQGKGKGWKKNVSVLLCPPCFV